MADIAMPKLVHLIILGVRTVDFSNSIFLFVSYLHVLFVFVLLNMFLCWSPTQRLKAAKPITEQQWRVETGRFW